MAMSLKPKEFHAFRKKAITERRDRTYKRTKAEFDVVEEIAKALKTSTQVAGNDTIYFIYLAKLVGRGRAVHLLAGPPSKKRKLN